jgi:DNA topoisomerase VI subunit A
MQSNSSKKSTCLGAILMLTTLSLSSCADNARIQECKNIKKIISTNSAEVVELSKEQKPYSRYDIKRAELQLQKQRFTKRTGNWSKTIKLNVVSKSFKLAVTHRNFKAHSI